jgi:hypothetical protein
MPLQEASEMFASIALGTTVPPKELNSGVDPNSVAVNVAPQEYQQYVAPAPQPAPTYVVQEQPQQMQFLHTQEQPQQPQQYPPQYSAQFVVPSGAIRPRRTLSCDRSRPWRPRPDLSLTGGSMRGAQGLQAALRQAGAISPQGGSQSCRKERGGRVHGDVST